MFAILLQAFHTNGFPMKETDIIDQLKRLIASNPDLDYLALIRRYQMTDEQVLYYKYVKDYKKVTSTKLSKAFHLGISKASKQLTRLVDKGYLIRYAEQQESEKQFVYKIKQKLAEDYDEQEHF